MPTKERIADMTVTTTQLAAVLGITNRRVQQLTQDGVLTTVSRGNLSLVTQCRPTMPALPVAG